MLRALEGQLIYFPVRVAGDGPPVHVPGATAVEEVWLETADGVRVHGIHAAAPAASADLLFFHGNAGNLYDRLDNVSQLVELGFNVLIIDYRGYGKSGGTPSEEGLYRDGMAALQYLGERESFDPARLVLFGRSLGATVAIELGMRERVGAVIVESAFTSVQDMARLHYAWIPSVVLRAMKHQFDSIAKVPKLKAPTLYVHGERDDIVPAEMGRRLFEAGAEPKEWYGIPGAGHNDTAFLGGADYFTRLREFIEKHVSR